MVGTLRFAYPTILHFDILLRCTAIDYLLGKLVGALVRRPVEAPQTRFAETGIFTSHFNADLGRRDCAAKTYRFSFPPHQPHLRAIPPHRHDTWSAGSGGREAPARERHCRAAPSLSWGCERSIRGVIAYGKTVWFWQPWLVSSWRRLIESHRVRSVRFPAPSHHGGASEQVQLGRVAPRERAGMSASLT
jgi:hypothetical protein